MISAKIPNMTHAGVQCVQMPQGASPRLRVATVSLSAVGALVNKTSLPIAAVKRSFADEYGGQGSRAWSPPG